MPTFIQTKAASPWAGDMRQGHTKYLILLFQEDSGWQSDLLS